jgi:uncharacterized membrane protein YdbT with pleckstrin-like domain
MQPDQQPAQEQPQYDTPEAETQPNQSTPQMVQVSRPHEPTPPQMTEEVRARHEESKRKYPNLNLSDGEYVISAVKRHPIGLFSIFGFVGLLLVGLISVIPLYAAMQDSSGSGTPSIAVVSIIVLLLAALVVIGGYIAVYIYTNNRFFLTNESVIQEIQTSLFSKHEQTVSLGSVEDASYYQHGILQYIFNYGRIRLSTMGEETTYRFNYVANPKREIATLNDAVEAFKNGRPVVGHGHRKEQ